jgi:rhamnosyltransferase subunit B
MRVLLVTIGSHGDVHPFIGIGRQLRKRGHQVIVLVSGYFESLVREAGLDFIPLGSAEDFKTIAADPQIWHPRRGFAYILRAVLDAVPDVYEKVADNYLPGQTVMAFSSLALGARIAQEKFNIPAATVHLSPALFRSAYDTPLLSGVPRLPWVWSRKLLFSFADRWILDRIAAGPVNSFRAALGLPPAKNILGSWWHSPQRVICLFPDWFAPPQPDWPPNLAMPGFPLYDERDLRGLTPELDKFLAAGPPPIVITPGSAMFHGHEFFATATAACQLLNRPGLLLSRHRDHIPQNLPPTILHADYAPFSLLLPRSAALIHHGGIGTTAQAFAAGLPQLIMPMSHDQPDNAHRVECLGAGRSLPPKQFTAPAVAAALKDLIDSPKTRDSCRALATKFNGVDALSQTADLIEQLLKNQTIAPPTQEPARS